MTYLKLGLYALLAGGLAYAGWTINGWRLDAAAKEAIETQLDAERKAHAESEAARVELSADLALAEGKVREKVRTIIRRVPVLVGDNRACDLGDELVGQLNKVRGYE